MIEAEVLKKWFKREQRDLPWRENRSPYAVWVSEMMLQQTQVAVVIPYFERWMRRFPTVQDLANASLDEVIKLWEGLGYYSRARYLHAGARQIVEKFDGVFPNSLEELQQIKGLGPYTIGAIRSFAFHQRTPAVDGNVIRVLSRYFMLHDDMSKPSGVQKVWQVAESLLPEKESWVINEALIELGATICMRNPKCQECPLRNTCKGYANGIAETLPHKSSKTKIEPLYRAVAIVEHENRVLIRRGKKGEIMSDLHEFPYFEICSDGIDKQALMRKVQQLLDCRLSWKAELPEVKHSFTRYRVKLTPMHFICVTPPKHDTEFQWVELENLSQLAFSSGHRRILAMLN